MGCTSSTPEMVDLRPVVYEPAGTYSAENIKEIETTAFQIGLDKVTEVLGCPVAPSTQLQINALMLARKSTRSMTTTDKIAAGIQHKRQILAFYMSRPDASIVVDLLNLLEMKLTPAGSLLSMDFDCTARASVLLDARTLVDKLSSC